MSRKNPGPTRAKRLRSDDPRKPIVIELMHVAWRVLDETYCLDGGVVVIAGVVQHQRDRPGQARRSDLPQQFAHRLGVDHRGVGRGDQSVRHRIPRP
jgi:hypothetical protein